MVEVPEVMPRGFKIPVTGIVDTSDWSEAVVILLCLLLGRRLVPYSDWSELTKANVREHIDVIIERDYPGKRPGRL